MNEANEPGWGQWLWQSRLMARRRERVGRWTPAHIEFLQRARLAWAEGKQLCDEAPYNTQVVSSTLALHRFGEVVFWSLVALAHRAEGQPVEFEPAQNIAELAARAGIQFEALVSGPTKVRTIMACIDGWMFTTPNIKTLTSTVEANSETDFRDLAITTLGLADEDPRGIERIWFQRLLRVGVPLLLAMTGIAGTLVYRDQSRLAADTSFPWRASSVYPEPGCQSPRQGCEQDHFFFHTNNDRDPWIEFDLSSRPSVSKVTILNRTDCRGCSGRAIPLVIEVSDDHEHWKTVAQRDEDFVSFTASFPRTPAKWLRLRVLKRTAFHLKQVRIER